MLCWFAMSCLPLDPDNDLDSRHCTGGARRALSAMGFPPAQRVVFSLSRFAQRRRVEDPQKGKARRCRAGRAASVRTDALWNGAPMVRGIMHRLVRNIHLIEKNGLLRTMTPSEVWNSERDPNRAAQATLSYLGITIDSEFRSVSAFLRSCAESPFGEICLGVETPGGRVWLSHDHASIIYMNEYGGKPPWGRLKQSPNQGGSQNVCKLLFGALVSLLAH